MDSADELKRLEVVRNRVRQLARRYGWFADAIRQAFADYLILSARFLTEQSGHHDRERQLAREVLAAGYLTDPNYVDNRPCLFVPVDGLCPTKLAECLLKQRQDKPTPKSLLEKSARAALAAFDRHTKYQAGDLPDGEREAMAVEYRAKVRAQTHVTFTWHVIVAQPGDWQEPADPHSLERTHLERFTDVEYRTIALYRLGGLADTGSTRPIVQRPTSTGNRVREVAAYAAWLSRCPINSSDREHSQPDLVVEAFPPVIAEEMIQEIEHWVSEENAARKPHEANMTVASQPQEQIKPSEIALTADHESILGVLGKSVTKCMTVIDVAGGGGIRNRETVGLLLVELEKEELVTRPFGQRKGYRLTAEGRIRAQAIEAAKTTAQMPT